MNIGGHLLGTPRTGLIGLLVLSLVTPLPAWSFSTPLGNVRGAQASKISLDAGKTWLALSGRSMPVLKGASLRTQGGTVGVELTDGSRFTVLPFSALTFEDSKGTPRISLSYGRMIFHLPVDTRVDIVTQTARLQPAAREVVMEGEVFAIGTSLMGLKMTQGTLQVRSLENGARPILASQEPVFLPKRPDTRDRLFSTDAPLPVPPNAKAVFTPGGESIGYLDPQSRLVIDPGFTRNLTRPFSPKLIRLAAASIPETHRQDDATPLFDVQGAYVGYLAGPVFYAQTQAQQQAPTGAAPRDITPATALAGAGLAVVVGVGIAAAAGGFSDEDDDDECPATPVRPGC